MIFLILEERGQRRDFIGGLGFADRIGILRLAVPSKDRFWLLSRQASPQPKKPRSPVTVRAFALIGMAVIERRQPPLGAGLRSVGSAGSSRRFR